MQKLGSKIGLLFESQADIMSAPTAKEETHYHWREFEEVEAVTSALISLGCEVDKIGTLDNLLEKWRIQQLPDFVWNLSVRTVSRNRTALAPAILEQLQIPYTGGDATIKSLTLNKDLLKPVLQWCGVLTPRWYRYSNAEDIQSLPPWSVSILKPSCEGYSLGLQRFENRQGINGLCDAIANLQQSFGVPVLCEELIRGREITVGVVGNFTPSLLGGIETVNSEGKALQEEVLDLRAKRQGSFQKIAVDLSSPELRNLGEVVEKLMQFFSPLDYATFDFRIAADGRAYLLDINADATLNPQRSFAQIALQNGLSYQQLIEMILQASLKRWEV
ncbi:MAG: D-alanine--D-alanine ligase [Cyanobacteria bacterium P01_A01_bin.84]